MSEALHIRLYKKGDERRILELFGRHSAAAKCRYLIGNGVSEIIRQAMAL